MAYDKNKDYAQEAIDRAKAGDWAGAKESLSYRDQKIADTGNNYGKTSADLFYELWDQYGGSAQPVQNQWAGTDFAQQAADAAKAGNWDAVTSALNKRDEKIAATGNNYGKTSLDVYNDLWNQYNPKQTTSDGFSYDSAPGYYDEYSAQIDAKLNALLNRDKFSYDAASDPLYGQYKDQYNREGQRAMQNTLGQVSARTGGMASSYANTAAQQANQVYAQQLADKIPELYQLAYEMYLKDIDLQVQDLGLLQDASDTAYGRYRDTMSDWRDDRNFAYDAYRNDIADGQWQQELNFSAMESAYDRAMNMLQMGVMPSEALLSKGGISAEQAQGYIDNGYMTEKSRYDTEWAHQVAQDALAQSNWEKEFDYMKQQDANQNSGGGGSGGSGGSGSGGSGGEKTETKKTNTVKTAYAQKDASGNDYEDDVEVDQNSILALGYGPISMARLAELVDSGEVEEYTEGNVIKFKKSTKSNSNSVPWPSPYNWHY